MALVVFLKGINVGGHRSVRPTALAGRLRSIGLVSVGSAGTFVVRSPTLRAKLREEISRHVPFEAEVMICTGRAVLELISRDPFVGQRASRDVVQFVSVMRRRPSGPPAAPVTIPASGRWGLRVLGHHGPFVFGLHRRQMKAIGHLGQLEKIVGTSLATRSWSTILSVGELLRP